MPSTGMHRARRTFQLPMSSLNQSARVRRALRKAVSPEVIGQAMTPSMARMMPILPMVMVQMVYTVLALPPPISLSFSTPSRVTPAAAQIRAIMPSATMAP